MTVGRRRRKPSFLASAFFLSELSVLAVFCSLIFFFALAFVIASPLSFVEGSDQQKVGEEQVVSENSNITVALSRDAENNITSAVGIENKNGTSFADMIDRALEKEFTENGEQDTANDAGGFNNSVTEQQAVLETVARVKHKKNETKAKVEKSFQIHDVFNLDNDNGAEDINR